MCYVGQTSRTVKIRIKEHLAKIKLFKKLYSDNVAFEKNIILCKDSEVLYRHFAIDHDINLDFSFQVFVTNLCIYRLRLENDMILILNTRSPFGLNTMSILNVHNFEPYIS